MKKIYKSFAITLAILFTVSFTGKQVKAEPVTATLAAATVTVAVGVLIGTLVQELCNTIDDTVTAFERQSVYQSVMEENDRRQLYEDTMAEINAYTEKRKQEVLEEGYYNLHFKQMSDEERLTYLTNAQEYFNSLPSNPTPAQQLAYTALKTLEAQSSQISVNDTDYSISMKGNVYSQLYEDCLVDFISGIYDSSFSIGVSNGIRQLLMKNPSLGNSKHFPSLVSKYGAVTCYQDKVVMSNGERTNKEYYFYSILSDGHKIAFASHPGIGVDNKRLLTGTFMYQWYEFDLGTSGSSYSVSVTQKYSNNPDTYSQLVIGYIGFLTSSGSAPSLTYFEDISDVHTYIFLFDNFENAELMCNDFLGSIVVANPSESVVSDSPIAADVNLSSVEKAIQAQKDALGVDDVDVVVSSDSVSVGGLELSLDIDISETIDKFKTPGSITTKFPFSIPFDIYHIFNTFSAAPVAPHFVIPFDFTSIGAEKYEIEIDLTEYEWIANIVRWLVYAIFLIGLAILTNKAIGRG